MVRRLSAEGRAELEARRERLQLELRLIEGELRTDQALRLQAAARPVAGRPSVVGGEPCRFLSREPTRGQKSLTDLP
jgi:hypothetical protein